MPKIKSEPDLPTCTNANHHPPYQPASLFLPARAQHKPVSQGSARFLSLAERNKEFEEKKRAAPYPSPKKHVPSHTTALPPAPLFAGPVREDIARQTNNTHPTPPPPPTTTTKTPPVATELQLLPLLDLVAPYMDFQIALARLSGREERKAQRAARRVRRVVDKVRGYGGEWGLDLGGDSKEDSEDSGSEGYEDEEEGE